MGTKPSIKSWTHPVGALKELLEMRCNLKGSLLLCTYLWPNRLKEFSSGSSHKECKYYQGIIHKTHHGGNIETDHHGISLIPQDVEKYFVFYNFTTPLPGNLKKVLDNNITTRDEKISLNGLGITKGEYLDVSMMLKIVKEVAQYYTVFEHGLPRPQKDLNCQDRTIVAGPGMNPAPICFY